MQLRTKSLLRDGLILLGVLAMLTLLAIGQIAAVVLIMVPMVFLFFGKRHQNEGESDGVDESPDR
jgi:hypothetical protein